MLLKSATRRSQLASQLIRSRPLRNLVVPSLDRSKQRLHLLLSQIPKQTAQRQEESIVGHAFSRSLMQHLSLPHFVDRKSTRLNSSHSQISYAVFCLKKKKQ